MRSRIPPVTRDDIARVLDTDATLDHRLEEITPRSGDRDDDTDIALLPAEEKTRQRRRLR